MCGLIWLFVSTTQLILQQRHIGSVLWVSLQRAGSADKNITQRQASSNTRQLCLSTSDSWRHVYCTTDQQVTCSGTPALATCKWQVARATLTAAPWRLDAGATAEIHNAQPTCGSSKSLLPKPTAHAVDASASPATGQQHTTNACNVAPTSCSLSSLTP